MTIQEGEPTGPRFDINAEARAHGEYLKMPQREDESDVRYRERIAGILRSQGKIIEAHEVSSGRRWDDPDNGEIEPMTGVVGALAQALSGHEYSPHDPERQVGDDIAVGIASTHRDRTGEMIAGLFDTVGPETGMDIIDGLFGRD